MEVIALIRGEVQRNSVKLAVDRRAQAVFRAQSLGLIRI
jgi:ATP/maltotriose-dependent transcriptional regulator MalT